MRGNAAFVRSPTPPGQSADTRRTCLAMPAITADDGQVRMGGAPGGGVGVVRDPPWSRRLLFGRPILAAFVGAVILGSVYSPGCWSDGLEVSAALAVLNPVMVYGRPLNLRRGDRQRP